MSKVEQLINEFNLDNLKRLFRYKSKRFKEIDKELDNYNTELFQEGNLIGELYLPEDGESLIVVSFKVNKELTEKSSKKEQYQKAKEILNSDKYYNYTGGFFIFYDTQGNFRFSFIYCTPTSKGTREWSEFKRYSYYVSKSINNSTFIKQIEEANFNSIESIIQAFSVERVTEEFYKELSNWYYWAMDKVEFPTDYKYSENEEKDREIRVATNLIRLITRIIFIWFLKEKQLVPEVLFNEKELKNIVKDFGQSNNYYNAILQNLFFGTLNQKVQDRRFVTEGDFLENRKEYGIKTFIGIEISF